VITSGMTSGAKIMPENNVRPRKAEKRTSAMAPSVPSTSASVAETKAIRKVTQAASSNSSLRSSSPYHFSEKPPHTVTSRDSLNENSMSSTIGR
jgi:hypothetical protein